MRSNISRIIGSKRLAMIYATIFLWIELGILAAVFESSILNLSAYFLALTGFVGSYIFGESMRKSPSASIFKGGKNSSREVLLYVVILLWSVLGNYSVIKGLDLIEMSAYFAALTPFVGSYVLGETFKKEEGDGI